MAERRDASHCLPVFSAAALGIAQHLSEFGIDYDRVRVVLVRPPSDTAKDTTVAFTPASPDLTLSLTVEVRSSDEVFDVGIQFLSGPSPVFKGEGRARSHTADQEAPPQAQIAVNYVGPGSNVARISVSPKTTTLPSDQSLVFVAAAFDANNNPVSPGPLSWTTSDPSVATVSAGGSLQAQGKRGTVVVTATTPTGVSDRATVAVVPTPASIALVSGGGQTGMVGTPLTTPGVIQVNAADGLGVPGVAVSFVSPRGGHVGSPAAVTDANGRASTSLTLGTVAGPQVFGASVGELRAILPETALPGGPSAIDIVSGNGQTDTVRKSLMPLVVRVADQFGNPISGIDGFVGPECRPRLARRHELDDRRRWPCDDDLHTRQRHRKRDRDCFGERSREPRHFQFPGNRRGAVNDRRRFGQRAKGTCRHSARRAARRESRGRCGRSGERRNRELDGSQRKRCFCVYDGCKWSIVGDLDAWIAHRFCLGHRRDRQRKTRHVRCDGTTGHRRRCCFLDSTDERNGRRNDVHHSRRIARRIRKPDGCRQSDHDRTGQQPRRRGARRHSRSRRNEWSRDVQRSRDR